MREVRTCYVEYHSREWEILVESGWTTWVVNTISEGVQIAKMIKTKWR